MNPKYSFLIIGISLLLSGFLNSAQAQPCSRFEIELETDNVLPQCNVQNGAIVIVDGNGGLSPYQYSLNNDTSFTFDTAFTNLSQGVYDLYVRDALGCIDTVSVELTFRLFQSQVTPLNIFTPNGDGFNDTWVIGGIQQFNSSQVHVFNRWGQQVHKNTAYDNSFGWDGTQGGSQLPEGTYFYVITLLNGCEEEFLKGSVTILR